MPMPDPEDEEDGPELGNSMNGEKSNDGSWPYSLGDGRPKADWWGRAAIITAVRGVGTSGGDEVERSNRWRGWTFARSWSRRGGRWQSDYPPEGGEEMAER